VPKWKSLAQYDDQKIYFKGLIEFLRDVDKSTFKKGNSIAKNSTLNSPHAGEFLVFN
jgi:hypothetical protein